LKHGRYDPARDVLRRYDNEPIGGGNPYCACVGCGKSEPDINMRISGHSSGCHEVARIETEHALYDVRSQVLELLAQLSDEQAEAFLEEVDRLCGRDKYDEGYVATELALQEMNTLFMMVKAEVEASSGPPTP